LRASSLCRGGRGPWFSGDDCGTDVLSRYYRRPTWPWHRWVGFCMEPVAIENYVGGEAGRLPANVCFHRGPSRSGVIEMSLFVGMQGPVDLNVILVGR